MSNSATFSYAQAAKGQSAAQSVGSQSNSAPSQAPSTTSTQSRDVAATPSTRAPSVAISTTSNDGSQNTRSSSVKPESYTLNSNDSDSVSTSDKVAELSGQPSQVAEKALGEIVPQVTERRGRGQTLNSQTTDVSDSKKARKGKKSKATEKESEPDQDQAKKENVPPKRALSEAPVPPVNIWTVRQEERAAKFKAAPPATTQSHAPSTTNGGQSNGLPNPIPQDSKQRAPQNEGTEATAIQSRPLSGGVKPPKKDIEQSRSNNNQNSRRSAPRGARANIGEPLETINPIATNTSSWPTPETAASGLKTQVGTGKTEKEQKEESGPNKPRQKKEWTTMEFVPTVNFETPMPTRGPRGGRAGGARGGRDATGRGNHSGNAAADRTQDGGAAPGAVSVALPASKRASTDITTSRKSQIQAGSGKASGEMNSTSSRADVSKQNLADSAQGITGQRSPSRATSLNQRTDELKMSLPARDNNFHGTKDSAFQGQNGASRNERTRGSTRGRGGHSGTNGVGHPQSQFSQGLPPYNYQVNGTANSRQPAHSYAASYTQMPYGNPFPIQSTGSSHRSRPSSGNNRAQGSARHQSSRAAYPLAGMPYDPTMYSHGSSQYTPYTDPNHLLSGVLSQVEYYFSIDNLCKDWYLRKFMDSQGFVPLNVIAGFKRMQEIATDFQLIRIACDSSPHIEYIVTEQGQDKVRRREQWEPWVLAMDVRHPTAQHDGPVNYRPFESQMAFWPQLMQYGAMAPIFSPTGTESHFPHYDNGNSVVSPTNNGLNGNVRPSDSQLSATVPEFSPTGNPGMEIPSQQPMVSSDAGSNAFKADNIHKKTLSPAFSEHVSPLANGSHKFDGVEQNGLGNEPAMNGINGSRGTEEY
ncbi:hypothetical protein F4804DRAFT_329085 [Jackrogersella minutella]|nr:hypothetical protein F4804DRAFT_329085 [Jackrogersella minutella]